MTNNSERPFTVTDRRHATDDLGQPLLAADVDGDPHDRPNPDQAFADAVDAARMDRILSDARDPARPLPTADELFAMVQYGRALRQNDKAAQVAAVAMLDQALGGRTTAPAPGGVVAAGGYCAPADAVPPDVPSITRSLTDALGPPSWSVPAPLPAGAADAALVLYLAACTQCSQAGRNLGEGQAQHMAVPFAGEADRDRWAEQHALRRGHRVALVEQHPSTGSTITRYIHGPAAAPEPVRAAVPYEPPLIAFVVRSGKEPDLLCTIPERAGAAWLLTAAHACLLGRGSLGIEQPHRALYVGRLSSVVAPGHVRPEYEIRIDGLLGATDEQFGRPIGMTMTVASHLSPDQVEDTCEAIISRVHRVPRNLFSVVVMADPGPGPEPDPEADAVLREQRLAAREQHRAGGGQPVDAVREFVDREAPRGPVAEVAETTDDR